MTYHNIKTKIQNNKNIVINVLGCIYNKGFGVLLLILLHYRYIYHILTIMQCLVFGLPYYLFLTGFSLLM